MTGPAPPRAAVRPDELFPDAPPGAVAPESTMALFRARNRRWHEEHGFWSWAWVAALVAGPAALYVFGEPSLALWLAGLLLAIAIVTELVFWNEAGDEFWQAWAAARGLKLGDAAPWLHTSVPLLQKGDEREFHRVLTGRVGSSDATLATYTYTEVSYDDEGRRSETDYDFTIAILQVPAACASRYAGVYLRRKGLSVGGMFDALTHDRSVRLESAEFHKRYELRVADEQDDIALFELFSTTFIDQLTHAPEIQWEQVGGLLVCFRKGHADSARELDELCEGAARVYRRYCEEQR